MDKKIGVTQEKDAWIRCQHLSSICGSSAITRGSRMSAIMFPTLEESPLSAATTGCDLGCLPAMRGLFFLTNSLRRDILWLGPQVVHSLIGSVTSLGPPCSPGLWLFMTVPAGFSWHGHVPCFGRLAHPRSQISCPCLPPAQWPWVWQPSWTWAPITGLLSGPVPGPHCYVQLCQGQASSRSNTHCSQYFCMFAFRFNYERLEFQVATTPLFLFLFFAFL